MGLRCVQRPSQFPEQGCGRFDPEPVTKTFDGAEIAFRQRTGQAFLCRQAPLQQIQMSGLGLIPFETGYPAQIAGVEDIGRHGEAF